jgi:hypothetical protein
MPKNTPPSSFKTARSATSSKFGSLVSLFKRTQSVAPNHTFTPTSLPRQSMPIPPRPKRGTLFSEGNDPALVSRPSTTRCDYCSDRERYTFHKLAHPEEDVDWRPVSASPPEAAASGYMCDTCATAFTAQSAKDDGQSRPVNSFQSEVPPDHGPQEGSSTHKKRARPSYQELSRVIRPNPPSVLNSNAN